MPTESAYLLAGLLFIAAALGYIFAKFGDTDEEDVSSEKLSSDYMKGLGIDSGQFYIDDASGLSRQNKLSARSITKVLAIKIQADIV